jgi:hypothetical protein
MASPDRRLQGADFKDIVVLQKEIELKGKPAPTGSQ